MPNKENTKTLYGNVQEYNYHYKTVCIPDFIRIWKVVSENSL